jgi:alpha-beta hydrolase superfamily lysophospholipase
MRIKLFLPGVLFCSLVLLSACAPQFTPPHSPPLAEPQLKATSFVSFDGTELDLRTWLPPDGIDGPKCIFIAVHGFNDYSNFIKNSALYFNTRGIVVYAYDQRGFGNTPVRGRWSSTEVMGRDLETLVQLVGQKYPDLPVFLLGHSMGSAVVIQAMAGENHPDVAGAILVAPAVWARSTMPFYQTGALWLVAHTIPWYTVTGKSLKRQACSNTEVLRELGRDPLVIKETRFDTIYGLQDLMDAAYAGAENYSLRTLVLYGRHDEIIPQEPVLDVFRRFPAESAGQKEMILYEDGYHMLLRDLQAENVRHDIVAWINDALTATSGQLLRNN